MRQGRNWQKTAAVGRYGEYRTRSYHYEPKLVKPSIVVRLSAITGNSFISKNMKGNRKTRKPISLPTITMDKDH